MNDCGECLLMIEDELCICWVVEIVICEINLLRKKEIIFECKNCRVDEVI